jgi:hypothetical protein
VFLAGLMIGGTAGNGGAAPGFVIKLQEAATIRAIGNDTDNLLRGTSSIVNPNWLPSWTRFGNQRKVLNLIGKLA